MADDGIFATNAEIERKAGANASAVSVAVAYTDDYIAQAESKINCMTRFNWSDAYAGLDADVKSILKEAGSNLAAIYVIQYDMSGFTSNIEAEDMITILRDQFQTNIQILRDIKVQTFMENA